MRVKEKTKKEIEDKFLQMGDYVKMDYLSSCLKIGLDYDTKKFVLIKLAGLYEERKMCLEAARLMLTAAEINTTYRGQITDFVKSCELFVKGGDYIVAEVAMKKALAIADEEQKSGIRRSVKEYFKTQGKFLMKNDKRNQALKLFERFFEFNLDFDEREEIGKILMQLYENLGKIRDYDRIKKFLASRH